MDRQTQELAAEPELDRAARLRTALLHLSRRLRSAEGSAPLTPAEYSVLAAVVRRGPLRSSALAELEGLNPTMVSRLLAGLCLQGVLTRDGDEADGRATVVSASPQGRRLHSRLRRARALALDRTLQQLPAEQRMALYSALPALEALERLLGGEAE